MLAADDNEGTAAAAAADAQPAAAVPAPAAPAAAPPAVSPAPVEHLLDASAAAPPVVPAAGEEPSAQPADAPPAPAVVEAAARPTAEEEAAHAAAPAVGADVAEAQLADAQTATPENGNAGAGLLGKIKERVGHTVERVSEMETVKKGVGFVVDTSKAVGEKVRESERVQQGVEFVKKKTTELAESERVQKGLEYAKDTAKVVTEKTQKGLEVVSEKTQMGLEYAKEKTKAVREGAGTVWEKGRGSIQRARAEVGNMAWRGSARETLDIAAREEQWRGIKVQGAEEISVPARTEHTSAYHVAKGSTLRWTFRVKDHDIGFGVRVRVQEWGGSREDEVLGVERYDSTDTISGSWVADENRTIVLSFDNRYSRLRSKTVAYLVGTEKPPVSAEQSSEAGVSVSTSSAEPGPVVTPKPIV